MILKKPTSAQQPLVTAIFTLSLANNGIKNQPDTSTHNDAKCNICQYSLPKNQANASAENHS